MPNIASKNIIITGASGGIGEKLVRKVASGGGNPILIARSEDKLHRIQQEINRNYAVNCYIYPADLTNMSQWTSVMTNIIDDVDQIDAIINNAGFGIFDLIVDSNWQDTIDMFQLNVFALMQGINHVLPEMIKNGHGHIINIASQAGKIATPKSAVYAATKHAVIGYSNALRLEVEDKGIFVTTVNLGPVKTNFFTIADPSGSYQQSVNRYMLDPDDVAEKVVQVLFTKKREINMPSWMDIGSRMYQIFPGLMERLLKKQFQKK